MNSVFYNTLQYNLRLPFSYGTNDCALFAANILKECTGIDFASDYRGRYNSKYSAYRLLAKNGGNEAILLRKGFVKIHNNYAKAGDVCIYKNAFGIYDGRNCFFAGGVYVSPSFADGIYTFRRI